MVILNSDFENSDREYNFTIQQPLYSLFFTVIEKLNGEKDNATDEQIKEEALKKKEEIQKETGGIVITPYTKKEENKGCC